MCLLLTLTSIGFSQRYLFNNERNGTMVMQLTGSPRDTAFCGYLSHVANDTTIFGSAGFRTGNRMKVTVGGVFTGITPTGFMSMLGQRGSSNRSIDKIASGLLSLTIRDSATNRYLTSMNLYGGITNTGKAAGIIMSDIDTTGKFISIQPSYYGLMTNYDSLPFSMIIAPNFYLHGNIRNMNSWGQQGSYSLINKCKRLRTLTTDSLYTYAFDTSGVRYTFRYGTHKMMHSFTTAGLYIGTPTVTGGTILNENGLEAIGTAKRKMNIYQSFAQMYGSSITGYGSAAAPAKYLEYPDTGRYAGYAGLMAQKFTYSPDSLFQNLHGTFAIPYNAYNTSSILNDSIPVYIQLHANTALSDTTKKVLFEFEYTWEDVYDGIATLNHGYLYKNLTITHVNAGYYNQTVYIGSIKPTGRFNYSQISYRLSRIVWSTHMNNKFRWTSKTDYSGNTLQRDDLQKDVYVNGINFVYSVGNLGMRIGD